MNRKEIEQKYAIDAAGEKYFIEVLSANGRVIAKIKAPEQFSSYNGDRLAEQEAKKAKKQWASWRVVDSRGRRFESCKRNKPWSATRELISQNIDAAEFANDIVTKIPTAKRNLVKKALVNLGLPKQSVESIVERETLHIGEMLQDKRSIDSIAQYIYGVYKRKFGMDSAELNDTIRFQSDRKQTGQNVVGAFGGRSIKEWTNGTKEQPYLGLGKGDYRKRMNENQGIDKLAAKKSNDTPAKVLNIKIAKNSSGGYDGQVYYSKNGENDLVSPFGVYANGKWAFPFGRTSTRLTEKDKKIIEDKIKRLLAQKGFVVKDSAEFENDAVVLRKVAKPDPEDSYITIMMPDGKLSDHTWNSLKKAMDFVIQGNYKGAKVVGFPSRKVLAK